VNARGTFISIDLFAGGGGASHGIDLASGCSPVLAVNHSPAAIAMHEANHPMTVHRCESVYEVVPGEAAAGRMIHLLWASPDCTHFSKARGGKPRSQGIRSLAWVVEKWAKQVAPEVLMLENVAEFKTWGPLDENNKPIKERAGETYREFIGALEALGYVVENRVLKACDYGAPTTRKRLFLVCRRDGKPIVWPEPTHGPGRAAPYRIAAECIDWSIPVPSIFTRKKDLAEATQRRIAEGIRRYVLSGDPYIVNVDGKPYAPSMVQTGYGERKGQRPRCLNLEAPLGTIVAGGNKHALVAAFLAKHNGKTTGQPLSGPMHTVTGTDTKAVVVAGLSKHNLGNASMVSSFLIKYYGNDGWSGLNEPMHTIVSKDRFGLITVNIDGERYIITDIGMRMLSPRELARAQGFPDSYILTGTKKDKVARIGNSVSPPVVDALVRANFGGKGCPDAVDFSKRAQVPMFGLRFDQ